ncbi:zinc finger protein CONSTANS-LIKE 13 [Coffea arabica]|uniref:Zinc finger protein CONSTANS-LIKE 13 n=1 Tax=Coffea arabica TaxID=13443 RepID=A0A6P6WNH0_COFAR|nr:zinc finger protein CONSTANS-LIKE 13-like [Coffea arabica]
MVLMKSQKPEELESDGGVVGRRVCDFCGDAAALVYCRADSAKLCLACDRQVHSTNPLFTKHTRCLLCDACDSTPATIFCSTHSSVLCQNCDWDTHTNSSFSAVHDRRPLEGFCGCPSVTELLGILGFEELGKKALLVSDAPASAALKEASNTNSSRHDVDDAESVYELSDLLVWETPSIVSLDDLIMSSDSSFGRSLQAMGVPPLPKNRNATCGQHREEMLSQLRQMSKLEPNINCGQADVEPLVGFQLPVPEQNLQFGQKDESLDHNSELVLGSSYEASAFQWGSDKVEDEVQDISTLLGENIELNHIVPGKDSGVGDSPGPLRGSHEEQMHPPAAETLQTLPRPAIRELNSQERGSAISRYREKKKNRRFDKHIRYETRKVRAESRTRIRGRFAKMAR